MRRGASWRHIAPNLLAMCLLLLLFAALVLSVEDKSPTLDEQNHIARGLAYLQTGDLRLSQEHPPGVNAWEAWPLLLDPEIGLFRLSPRGLAPQLCHLDGQAFEVHARRAAPRREGQEKTGEERDTRGPWRDMEKPSLRWQWALHGARASTPPTQGRPASRAKSHEL